MSSRPFSLLLLGSFRTFFLLVLGAACGGKAVAPAQGSAAGAAAGSAFASAGGSGVISVSGGNGNATSGNRNATAGSGNATAGNGDATAGNGDAGDATAGNGGAGAGNGGAVAGNGGMSSAGSTSTGGSAGNGAGGTASEALSCARLAETCGPTQSESCCASRAVPGGSYDRKYNQEDFPATVSDFVLDRYEVTVGRFRNFVAAYSPDMIPAGAGKNPHNPRDPGWDPSWNALLPKTAAELKKQIQCGAANQTWTDSPSPASERLPIMCLSWFEAEAFCTWDSGRLPTDAEWTYVASGGAEQRLYPWGLAAPDCSYANYLGAANGSALPSSCVTPGSFQGAANAVGSESPKGDGKWGHADLGGNAPEWTQDFSQAIPSPCIDCANLMPNASSYRAVKGGAFYEQAQNMQVLFRSPGVQSLHSFGARCARAPHH